MTTLSFVSVTADSWEKKQNSPPALYVCLYVCALYSQHMTVPFLICRKCEGEVGESQELLRIQTNLTCQWAEVCAVRNPRVSVVKQNVSASLESVLLNR